MKKKMFPFLILSTALIFTSPSIPEAQASTSLTSESVESVDSDHQISPFAIEVELPGPIKYNVFVSNAQLKELVASKQNFGKALEIAELGLGLGSMGSAIAPSQLARILVNSPIDRMQTAADTGQDMYVGEYYSTPQPGLSTIPFRYYSKTPLTFK